MIHAKCGRANQAGPPHWHSSRNLQVPGNITLLPLLFYAPKLNPVERVWPSLREWFPSHCLPNDNAVNVGACC